MPGLLVAAAATLVLTSVGGDDDKPARPPLALLRGPHSQVETRLQPMLRTVASRVERIRGLRFRSLPRLELMSEQRLSSLGRRLARRQRRRADLSPQRLRREQRLERASIAFDQLAGLLPPQVSFGPDTKGGLDRVGGAFDYPRRRIVLVPDLIETHAQLEYTLAHELTHALESQHLNLRLGTLTRPGEAPAVHRAVVEGTATFVQDRYRRRYLHDAVPLAQRLAGMRSVIAAGPGAYAINAQAVFDYVDGALFVRRLHRRGGWGLIDQALERPPDRSRQILHPGSWPGAGGGQPIRLGVAGLLRNEWRPVAGGAAGEEHALVILLASGIESEALAGASGWKGGRFGVWRPRGAGGGCGPGCATGDVGVIGFHWQHRNDAEQFSLAVPAYMVAGLLAERVNGRTWKLDEGYAALGTSPRASALAFAPTAGLADALSHRAARVIDRGA